MIESLKVNNFQSLHDVNIEFGKFTVIVGASSSGKSALTRAMKAVASNALDSDNITKGTKSAAVSLRTADATVTIERSGGSSVYKLAKIGSEEQVYTKLNRSVPTEVTEALGILPSTQEVSSINFAGQFDAPYLLKDGASAVARVLGELTNVSTIFAAVREASKRAKNASALVNVRKKDQEKLIAQISEYANIGKQAKTITSAEEQLARCLELDSRIAQLATLLSSATAASDALTAIKEIPELPEVDQLLIAQKNLSSFKAILRTVAESRQIVKNADVNLLKINSALVQAETQLHTTLVSAGKCPTCNQDINA